MKKQNFTKKVKNNAQNTKQNQDFPNVPQTPKSEGTSEINKNQIKKHQKLILTAEQRIQKNTKAKNKSFALATNNNNSKVFQ
jgi:hypothetical protein